MTPLERVLAEEWDADGNGVDLISHSAAYARGPTEAARGVVVARLGTWPNDGMPRAQVAVTGKRALVWLLAHQYSANCYDDGYDEYHATCPDCGGYEPMQVTRRPDVRFGHAPDCAIAAIVTDALDVAAT